MRERDLRKKSRISLRSSGLRLLGSLWHSGGAQHQIAAALDTYHERPLRLWEIVRDHLRREVADQCDEFIEGRGFDMQAGNVRL